jgi:hypothetical protein
VRAMRFSRAGWIVVVTSFVATAHAQTAPGDTPVAQPSATPSTSPPPPIPAVIVQPPVTTVDPGTLEDANAGRNWLSPTALTPPAGTWSFSDYELLVVGASYGVTDHLVVSVDTMVPVISGFYWGYASAKYQIVKAGRLRVAVQGGLLAVGSQNTVTTTDGMGNTVATSSSVFTGGADIGGALTYCLDAGCYSHVDGFVGTAFAYQSDASVPLEFSAAVTARIARRVRLVVEADSAYLFGSDISGQLDGILAWYGLRFTSRQIGVDVGFVKPVCSGCSTDGVLPIGFPVVSFTYRAVD